MDYSTVNKNYARAVKTRDAQRISEVARVASELQKQGLTRTEALRVAERVVTNVGRVV